MSLRVSGDDVSSSALPPVSSDGADESVGAADYDVHWQLSVGRRGHLRLVHDDDLSPQVTRCGWRLRRPENGRGISILLLLLALHGRPDAFGNCLLEFREPWLTVNPLTVLLRRLRLLLFL